jgi:hypothetical protein
MQRRVLPYFAVAAQASQRLLAILELIPFVEFYTRAGNRLQMRRDRGCSVVGSDHQSLGGGSLTESFWLVTLAVC